FGFKPRSRRGDTGQGDLGAALGVGQLRRPAGRWGTLRSGGIARGPAPPAATVRSGSEEAAMEEHFVWMTTRRIKPGTLTEFERAWRPGPRPEGMLTAYAYWSDNEQQIIGVSFWASRQSCDAWRASDAEARRRAA